MEDDGPGSDDTIPHTHRPVETRAAPVTVSGQYQNIVKRVQQTVGAFTIVRHHTQIQQTHSPWLRLSQIMSSSPDTDREII